MRKHQLTSSYRQEGKWFLVELNLETLAQIYNTFDPSPFHERDLDDDAAQYIEDAAAELAGNADMKLVIYVQDSADDKDRVQLTEALHNYFSYRARVTRLQLKEKLRFGRLSLLIGLSFLALCFEISSLLHSRSGTLSQIVWEGLIIIGWVMLWKPLEIFLYDWWPLLGKIRLYERLQKIPVEFRKKI